MKIKPKDKHIEILSYTFNYKGQLHVARRATATEIKKAKIKSGCVCGEEFCDGQWLWRCMYAGGGVCEWYITSIVCAAQARQASRKGGYYVALDGLSISRRKPPECVKPIHGAPTGYWRLYNSCSECKKATVSFSTHPSETHIVQPRQYKDILNHGAAYGGVVDEQPC